MFACNPYVQKRYWATCLFIDLLKALFIMLSLILLIMSTNIGKPINGSITFK